MISRPGAFTTIASIVCLSAGCGAEATGDELAAEATNQLSGGASPPFYDPPAKLPNRNGDVIRHEPLTACLDPANPTPAPVTASRVLYRSTRRDGTATAVSGTVLVPKSPWVGPGQRPVIGYAVGTQGIGDTCAPSRLFTEGIEYEGVFMAGLLARGYALAVTDYEGLGTPGIHTYMDRLAQGHALLDVVRAAQRLPGTGLGGDSPVALFGYSQGGGAAASAAELAGTYAPELQVKGTAAGAVPADLTVLPANLDGTIWAEFLWFAIAGLSESYAFDITTMLNPAGVAFYREISDACVFDLANAALKESWRYTASGKSLDELAREEPFRTMIDEQRIGRLRPNAPVLVTHSLLDDTIPYAVGRQLATDWCALGAQVRLSPNVTPLHLGGMLNNAAELYEFLEARLAGLPMISTCR